MYKTNVKTDLFYVNICKHEHEKNMTRTCVKQIEGNEGSYTYLYPFEDLAQGSFYKSFYVCIK
jgi:hypothetical protein